MANHYKTLQVQPDSSQEEIKQAYRKAVVKNHPDKGGSEVIFHEVQAAYDVLGDPDKRKAYDETESKKPVESLRDSMEILVTDFISKCTQN